MGFLTPSTKKITPILFWKTIGAMLLWSCLGGLLLIAFAFSPSDIRFKISESLFLYFLGFCFIGQGIWSIKSKVYGGVDLDAGQYLMSKIFGWNNITPAYFGKSAVILGKINILVGTILLILGLTTTLYSKNYNWLTINIGDILYRNPFSANLIYRVFWVILIGLVLFLIVYQVYIITDIAKAPIKWMAVIVKIFALSVFVILFYFYFNYSKCQLTDILRKPVIITGTIKYNVDESQNNKCNWYRFTNRDKISIAISSGTVVSVYLPISMNRAFKENWLVEVEYTSVFHTANYVRILNK